MPRLMSHEDRLEKAVAKVNAKANGTRVWIAAPDGVIDRFVQWDGIGSRAGCNGAWSVWVYNNREFTRRGSSTSKTEAIEFVQGL